MALENLEFKDQIGLICEGRKNREKREEERRKRKKRKGRRRNQAKGMELGFLVWKLNSSRDLWNSKAWFSQ